MTRAPDSVTGPDPTTVEVQVRKVNATGAHIEADRLVVEEPLEIRLGLGPEDHRAISVTMRTPGADIELAVGFLFTEGILRGPDDVVQVRHCGPTPPGRHSPNVVRVEVSPEAPLDLDRLQRNFFATSSCGICGKASLDAVALIGSEVSSDVRVRGDVIHTLPDRLRRAQRTFDHTGGLHAAGLFGAEGDPVAVFEDIGRHNAVDKAIGSQVLGGRPALGDLVLVVSGRTSFEVLQKALVAQIPVVVAVGAPSSLAVDVAARFGMTLVGFARDGRFNVYTGGERVEVSV